MTAGATGWRWNEAGRAGRRKRVRSRASERNHVRTTEGETAGTDLSSSACAVDRFIIPPTPREGMVVLAHKGLRFKPESMAENHSTERDVLGRLAVRSARGAELVSVVDHAGLAFLAEPPEGRLDLQADPHVLRLDVNHLRREPHALVCLDDPHDVRLLQFELRRFVVDDRIRDDGPLPAELHAVHL